MTVTFAYNETSWDAGPIPGGMADRMVRPILDHLPAHDVDIARYPKPGSVNAYLSMPGIYGDRFLRGGVLLSHGIADKNIRIGRKVADFDYVIVPGPAHADRLKRTGCPPHMIVELGYPKLDPLYRSSIAYPKADVRVRVVYAPTHGGGGEAHHMNDKSSPGTRPARCTSWWDRDRILDLLPDDRFDVVVAPHPRHRPDRRATFTEYIGADVVVADGGSTIYEAWALGIPVVFPAWLTAAANMSRGGLEGAIYAGRLGRHAQWPEALAEQVERAAVEGMSERDVDFIDRVLPPEYRGKAGQLHAEFLADLDRKAASCSARP